jgi:protein SCO1/2
MLKHRTASLLAAVVTVALSPVTGAADLPRASFDAGTALDASQAAIGRSLPDLELADEHGRHFRLGDLRGQPLVISPIYTSCYHVCPTTTTHLKGVVVVANELLGGPVFRVLTVGFDTENDTQERMLSYARTRRIEDPQWIFASADAATMRELMEAIGFAYARAGGGFDHMVQATVVDGEGRIATQVYGQQFEAPLLADAVKRIVLGQRAEEATLPSLIERVRLICTVFDPRTGRYRVDYSIVIAFVVGVLCLGAVAVFLWRSWRELPSGKFTT